MNTEFIDKSYIITYSNWFEFNGKILAYRKKVLFAFIVITVKLLNFCFTIPFMKTRTNEELISDAKVARKNQKRQQNR